MGCGSTALIYLYNWPPAYITWVKNLWHIIAETYPNLFSYLEIPSIILSLWTVWYATKNLFQIKYLKSLIFFCHKITNFLSCISSLSPSHQYKCIAIGPLSIQLSTQLCTIQSGFNKKTIFTFWHQERSHAQTTVKIL